MPVPVPRISKQSAHPVIKQNNHLHPGDADQNQPSVFRNLTRTLPVSPTGPPPSFGTREEWINSLPSWRRTKPRRIWEDDIRIAEGHRLQHFQEGLTLAGNASVIKGAHAQACIPPLHTLLQNIGLAPLAPPAYPQLGCDGDADDEMSSESSVLDHGRFDNESQWSASSPTANMADDMEVEPQPEFDTTGDELTWRHGNDAIYSDRTYEKGAFTPVFEDESPGMVSGREIGSSPLGPMTPFGEFVDRAVAADQAYTAYDTNVVAGLGQQGPAQYDYQQKFNAAQSFPLYEPAEQVKEAPAPLLVTPTANTSYRKLADPLSEWIASYLWKVCTTGLSLPTAFSRPMSNAGNQYSHVPPRYLAGSVHSLLLSTLLQPSAIFLAMWYIVRLPVFFGAAGLGADHVNELHFRVELLGDVRAGPEREALEANAPFRLFLLGCMLANKWLDDHTFSNKTWHTISNVPILALNRLEFLALTIFSHDLSVPPRQWSQWLTHLASYHQSLASPTHPQPISRPSSNPHSIIRRAIQELIQASTSSDGVTPLARPEPVFLGMEERRKEKYDRDDNSAVSGVDVLEIDLDEDGPLREEYLPKRRVSAAGSVRSNNSRESLGQTRSVDCEKHAEVAKLLPPPAKWSPAGDEPILRTAHRVSGQYVAVQAPFPPPFQGPSYPQGQAAIRHPDDWVSSGAYVPRKPLALSYGFDGALHVPQPAHNASYPYVVPISAAHTRSQSLRYDQDTHPRNHVRSYSQTRFEYKCSDIRMTAQEPSEQPDVNWAASDQYGYIATYGHPFAMRTNLDHQATWLRA